jgi:hypothetical protein
LSPVMTLPLLLSVLAASPSLQLVTRVDGAPPVSGWVYARLGQAVVLEAKLTGATARSVRWFKLEPTTSSVDNTQPSFHFAPIDYQATPLSACDDRLTCPADVSPTVLPAVEQLPGVGTMAFQVTVTTDRGATLSTPGVSEVKYGGLTKAVHRVTVRRDDSYLGFVSELVNTPYIFGSAGPDGRNQTDLLIGADCADLAVYGLRRQGRKAEYTSSYGIDRQAPERHRAVSLDEGGRALDGKGATVPFGPSGVHEGDVLHFPGSRHVAVLWKDLPPLGVLDANDLMIHTCWAPPKIEPIGQTSCASLPWRVLRFPAK